MQIASMIMDQIPEICFRKRDARVLLHGDANGMLLAILLEKLRASGKHESTRVSVTVSQDHASFFTLYNVVWMNDLQDKVEYISNIKKIEDGSYDIIAAFPDIMTGADSESYYDGFFGRVPRFLSKGGVASLLTDCRWINKASGLMFQPCSSTKGANFFRFPCRPTLLQQDSARISQIILAWMHMCDSSQSETDTSRKEVKETT